MITNQLTFYDVNIDVIPTEKQEFIFDLHWPPKTDDIVHKIYEKIHVENHAIVFTRKKNACFSFK
jgi:hypothetical protein